MSQPIIVHADMNSYFASVEQQANPQLRGKSVGVCAYLHKNGCMIAASVEAKLLGLKVGMSMEEAKRIAPQTIFVQNDPAKYRSVTKRIFSLFDEITDRVEHYSIDEAFLDLTGWARDPAEAAFLMTKIRHRITNEIGDWLRCSIGIAPTRFLAKTASDMKKPNGLVTLFHDDLDKAWKKLSLEDVCGIGPRIRRRLNRLGIFTLTDLRAYPVANLMQFFGVYGYYLWAHVNGIEVDRLDVSQSRPPKSIGHSYCVPKIANEQRAIAGILVKLTERAGRRLRSYGLRAGTISVIVGGGGSQWIRLPEPVEDSFTLVHHASQLLHALWEGSPVDFLAITLGELVGASQQTRLDQHLSSSWTQSQDRAQRVSKAIDLVRDRYGDSSIRLASMMGTEDHAPDRIGFRKID